MLFKNYKLFKISFPPNPLKSNPLNSYSEIINYYL